MRIDTVGIVTACRPAALARCVASYIENTAHHGRAPRFIVCDDAVSPPDQQATRAVVERLRSTYAGTIQYVGLQEKLAVLRALIHARRVPQDVIKFAFFDVERTGAATHGANRNMLLLAGHGEPSLMVDDDTVCVTHRPLGYQDRVSFRTAADSLRDPSAVWVLGPDDDERQACRSERVDCLAEHERWLGRSIERSATVAVTVNGLIGDCGWGSPTPYLFLRGSSLARLAASDDLYDEYTTSRRVMRAVPHTTICDRTDDFMSTFFGLDLRTMVPPFPPICRGSDRVFAALVARCFGRNSFAHLPLVLAHRPIPPRTFWRGEIARSAAGIDFSALLCALIEVAGVSDASRRSAAARLSWYGEHLEQVASAAPAKFAASAAAAVRVALARQIAELEAALTERAGRASHFHRDLRAYVAALRRTLERSDSFVPLDLRLGRTDAEAQALTQRTVRRFGQLLAYWPTLFHAGRDLASEALASVDALHTN